MRSYRCRRHLRNRLILSFLYSFLLFFILVRITSFREEIALALPKVKNVEELARECAMSVNTLGRRFKEELNTTPHRWLTEQRKAHVTSLLADTDMPLQEIADVCGFATPSYLWDFCKKHLKATPAEIREIARCARTV